MYTARTFVVLLLCGFASLPSPAAEPDVRALRATRIYPAPDAAPVDNGVVLVREGRITGVSPRDDNTGPVPALAGACDGGVVLAGFQNSHIHLNGQAFFGAKATPAAALSKALTELLTRYGFTTAFDIASDRNNTLALRARIESGEIPGPRLLTAGAALFPYQGLPIYLDHLPAFVKAELPQPDTAASAVATVQQNMDAGADATKLFLVTPQGPKPPKHMAADIAAAAVAETHRRGKLVFAHPTDLDGVRAALAAKVDILAHPPLGTPGPWPAALLDQLRATNVHMVPTLKLLRYELARNKVPPEIAARIVQESVAEFGKFAAAGGKILFGTDTDYMTEFDTTEEYELMARAGMTPMQILASLTTTPAARWNESQQRGRVAPGMNADLVVLEGDPAQDVRNFAKVKCTIRAGKVIYAK